MIWYNIQGGLINLAVLFIEAFRDYTDRLYLGHPV